MGEEADCMIISPRLTREHDLRVVQKGQETWMEPEAQRSTPGLGEYCD